MPAINPTALLSPNSRWPSLCISSSANAPDSRRVRYPHSPQRSRTTPAACSAGRGGSLPPWFAGSCAGSGSRSRAARFHSDALCGNAGCAGSFADGAVFFAVRHERQHGVTEIQIVEILPVGDHQRVLILGVIEVIPDAFVFQQAADKREIRFGKLHAILTRRIGALNIQTVVGKAIARENLLDDVEHVQIRKIRLLRFCIKTTAVLSSSLYTNLS